MAFPPTCNFEVTATDAYTGTAVVTGALSGAYTNFDTDDARWFDGTWGSLGAPIVGMKLRLQNVPGLPLTMSIDQVKWGFLSG